MNEHDETTTTPSSNQTSTQEESPLTEPLEAMRKAALAGIGAVAVASDAVDEVFTELVKRGEVARDDAMRELKSVRSRGAESGSSASRYVRSRMDGFFNLLNLPSRGDVDSINAKLNILTRKMDEIQASQVDPATGTYGSRPSTPKDPTSA